MTGPVVTEADLQAWVDGCLAADRRAPVEAWLLEHPADAERITHYRQMNEALHGAYDEVLKQAVPEHLSAAARRQPRLRLSRYAAVLAWCALGGVLGVVLGGVGGWQLRDWYAAKGGAVQASQSFARHAALAHAVYSPEVRHPVEVGADQEAHLVAWLSKRLGSPLRVPHLGEQGYTLVGGRLLPGQAGDRSPGAQFMYQDGKGQRLTLYVRADASASRETAFHFAQEKSIGVFYWVDQKLGYALSGEVDKGELLRVANAVYKQLHRVSQ
jgi:anti-sigma factor RsiW